MSTRICKKRPTGASREAPWCARDSVTSSLIDQKKKNSQFCSSHQREDPLFSPRAPGSLPSSRAPNSHRASSRARQHRRAGERDLRHGRLWEGWCEKRGKARKVSSGKKKIAKSVEQAKGSRPFFIVSKKTQALFFSLLSLSPPRGPHSRPPPCKNADGAAHLRIPGARWSPRPGAQGWPLGGTLNRKRSRPIFLALVCF